MTTVREAAPEATAGPPDERVVLDVSDLRMRYGTHDVLTGVNFVARRGEVIGLLAPTAPERPPRSRSWKASGCGRPDR
ncbi:hypothetical protein [Fodinicola feengrottensis]|uniref:hypothetical protein n=1 Tax=Fodinicola feengrottensis TaxID=435914 RepID=UPI0024430A43|nr:hypothetical protein [Fodinicola feengrottensis]